MRIVSARDKLFPGAAQNDICPDKYDNDGNSERDDDDQKIGTVLWLMSMGSVIVFRIHTG